MSFMVLMIVLLFVTSLSYNKNFFWPYYFEGIQYFFIGTLLFGLYGLVKWKRELGLALIALYIGLFTLTGVTQAYQKYISVEEPKAEGLLMHTTAIDYIHEKVGADKFCLRIYTPPVRTHTYDYLLDLKARREGLTYPRTVYQDKECWYIIEQDTHTERRDDWIFGNIPEGAKMLEEHEVSDHVVIQKWTYPVRGE